MPVFKSNLIKTSVTVIKFCGANIFAGIGGSCYIYNKNDLSLMQTHVIFDGHAIYGIEVAENIDKILIYGANIIKIYEWKNNCMTEIDSKHLNDWVLIAKFIECNNNIASVSMHNQFTLLSLDLNILKSATCKERCISYCAAILYDIWEEIIVLSGTVFTEVLIWKPNNSNHKQELCEVQARLKGHKGVIFSLDYNYESGLICSTSDDRSAIIWSTYSGSLLKELENDNINIIIKHKLYGHLARVFRCKVLDNYILTAGEDSFVYIWSLDGKIIKKIEAHQGDSVWALDCIEKENILITGGGDNAITLFPLSTDVKEVKIKIEQGLPKKIGILKSHNLIVITNCGTLCYYNTTDHTWRESIYHEDLKSYALLEVSPCKNLVALAGYTGNIHLYKEENGMLKKIYFYETSTKGRIYSLHWLHCSLIAICEPEGKLTLINIEKDEWDIETQFCLPILKERWSTCACMLSPIHYAIGDRKGHIYVYCFGQENPIQIIKHAHNYMGVTNMYFSNNELISLGRNSTIKKYIFVKQRLSLISSDKLPFSWLVLYENALNMLVGFSGSKLVLWDYKSRRILFEHDCGGGHRSFAFDMADNLKLAYVKDKYINLISCAWNNLHAVDAVQGFHVKEINSLNAIVLMESKKYLLVSGGEDTTLRLSMIDEDGNFESNIVLKHHLSSIRALDILSYNEKHFIFSAGGRAQIIMWELCYDDKICCIEKYSFYEQNEEISEVRIMDICSIVINNIVYVLCACSDGNIKLYSLSLDSQLIFIKSIFYKLICILKLHVIKINHNIILISTATDGFIVFWNLTHIVNNIEAVDFFLISSIKCHQSSINSIASYKISESTYLILTGGDDNAFSLQLIEFNETFNLNVLNKFYNFKEHCAHITGVFVTNNYLITISIDQSVILFNWMIDNDKITCNLLEKYNSAVADLQGVKVFEYTTDFKVIIYGNGLELLTVHKT